MNFAGSQTGALYASSFVNESLQFSSSCTGFLVAWKPRWNCDISNGISFSCARCLCSDTGTAAQSFAHAGKRQSRAGEAFRYSEAGADALCSRPYYSTVMDAVPSQRQPCFTGLALLLLRVHSRSGEYGGRGTLHPCSVCLWEDSLAGCICVCGCEGLGLCQTDSVYTLVFIPTGVCAVTCRALAVMSYTHLAKLVSCSAVYVSGGEELQKGGRHHFGVRLSHPRAGPASSSSLCLHGKRHYNVAKLERAHGRLPTEGQKVGTTSVQCSEIEKKGAGTFCQIGI